MAKVKIVTDSTADMSIEELEKYHITMVPLSLSIDGQTFLDKVELGPEEFLDRMKKSKELPKTSQPSVGSFAKVYNELGADGSEIISIHISSGLSGTARCAESAASMTTSSVTVVDSKFTSIALSFQVIEAGKMAKEGKSVQEILNRLTTIQNNSKLTIIIHNLDNLVKGGRIGKLKGLVGSLLNIKPIANLEDGVLHPIAKARSQSQIVKYVVKQFKEDMREKKILGIGIAHANNLELSDRIKKAVLEICDYCTIAVEHTTPVISTHAGIGALAIMYYWDS